MAAESVSDTQSLASGFGGTMYNTPQGERWSFWLSFWLLIVGTVFMGLAVFSVPIFDHHKLDAGLFLWALAWLAQRLERQSAEAFTDLLSFLAQVATVVLLGFALFHLPIGQLSNARVLDAGLLAWSVVVLLALEDPTKLFDSLPKEMAVGRLVSDLAFLAAATFFACALFAIDLGAVNKVYAGLFCLSVGAVLRDADRHLMLRSFVAIGGSVTGDLVTFAAWVASATFIGLAIFSVSVAHLTSGGEVDAGLFAWGIAYVIRPLERFHWPSAISLPTGTLLKRPDQATVYYIENGVRHQIDDVGWLHARGGLRNVWVVWPSYLQQIPEGAPISSPPSSV